MSSSTSPSCPGNASCSGSYQCVQNGRLRPTRFSQVRLWDSLIAERGRAAERRPHQRVGDPVGVQPVTCLVQRRPDRLEIVRPVPGREAHVPVRERRAEGMRRRVEAPGAVLEPERREHPLGELPLRLGVERAVQERGIDLRRVRGRAPSARGGGRRTPHAPRSSSSRARSRRAAPCRAGRPARSTRCSGASARRSCAGTAEKRRSRRCGGPRPRRGGPRAAARVISTRSSVGTRQAFSQSRRVTRIRLASSESYGSDSSSGASRSSRRPISGSVKRSWMMRPRVASDSARDSVPSGGIDTRCSQPSTPAARAEVGDLREPLPEGCEVVHAADPIDTLLTVRARHRIAPMIDVLIIGDTFRSPELRHEVPLGVPDPFVYLEHDGARHVYVASMEVDRIRGLGLERRSCIRSRRSGSTSSTPRASASARSASSGPPGPAPMPASRSAVGAADLPGRAPRPAAAGRDRADRRPAALRRASPGQDAGAELDGIRSAQDAAEAGLAGRRRAPARGRERRRRPLARR